MDVPLWLVLVGLEFPALLGLLDCVQRPPHHFPEGRPDQVAWTRWLIVACLTVPVLVGYLILTGYYFVIVRRNAPGGPR